MSDDPFAPLDALAQPMLGRALTDANRLAIARALAAQPLGSSPVVVPDYLPLAEADPKCWWQSRTILGAAAVVLSQVLALVGAHLDAPQVLGILTDVVGLVGGIVAIRGRLRAAQPIARR